MAVVIGAVGSSLFHPAAGALMARAAGSGRVSLPLVAFSTVGTAGAAIVPFGVLVSVDGLGWATAAPVAAGGRSARLAVAAGAMIALAGTTVGASSAFLVAADLGTAHPAVAGVVATYSASGAVGGIVLAVRARRAGARAVLMAAVMTGTMAAATLPILPLPLTFVAMAVAGAGLSGSLPLLVSHARRPGESSAAGAVGRILGLAAGIGGAGSAVVGLAQSAVGYGPALTVTAVLAGAAALATAWFPCRSADPAPCSDPLLSASAPCCGGSCTCG